MDVHRRLHVSSPTQSVRASPVPNAIWVTAMIRLPIDPVRRTLLTRQPGDPVLAADERAGSLRGE